MEQKKQSHQCWHKPFTVDEETGRIEIHLLCPECEAKGRTLSATARWKHLQAVDKWLNWEGFPPRSVV